MELARHASEPQCLVERWSPDPAVTEQCRQLSSPGPQNHLCQQRWQLVSALLGQHVLVWIEARVSTYTALRHERAARWTGGAPMVYSRMLEWPTSVPTHDWPCGMFVIQSHSSILCHRNVCTVCIPQPRAVHAVCLCVATSYNGCAVHRNEVPNFFNSTKFFSCLDLKESQELFETTQMVSHLFLATSQADSRIVCPHNTHSLHDHDSHVPASPQRSHLTNQQLGLLPT